MDLFLKERLERYEKWVNEGKVPFSSKVIPIRESLLVQQWVVSTEQVVEFLRNARSFALIPCICRSHYQRCDNPIETCFVINDTADRYVKQGRGRHLSLKEAIEVLRYANERGLVHLTIYNPEQYAYAVCSCCSCCCHELQFLKRYGRVDMIARSDYLARTDLDACGNCGECVERCVFGARRLEEGFLQVDGAQCYGCGLCVTACPSFAITMERRMASSSA
jgi:NAD-dependent dihydropyrimidine dehydrogenase PreA subunit